MTLGLGSFAATSQLRHSSSLTRVGAIGQSLPASKPWKPAVLRDGNPPGPDDDLFAWAKGLLANEKPSHSVVQLGEGEIGYGMNPDRLDDCLQAAMATVLQIPPEQVPDLRLDEQSLLDGKDPDEISSQGWATIERWLAGRGLRLVFHERVPVARSRWIGVVARTSRTHPFGDHCLVMRHDELVFDPISTVKVPPNHRPVCYEPSDIGYGISFDRKEHHASI